MNKPFKTLSLLIAIVSAVPVVAIETNEVKAGASAVTLLAESQSVSKGTEKQLAEKLQNEFRKKLSIQRTVALVFTASGVLYALGALYFGNALGVFYGSVLTICSAPAAIDMHNLIKKYDHAMSDLDKLMAGDAIKTDIATEQNA